MGQPHSANIDAGKEFPRGGSKSAGIKKSSSASNIGNRNSQGSSSSCTSSSSDHGESCGKNCKNSQQVVVQRRRKMSEGAADLASMEFDGVQKANSISDNSSQACTMDHISNNGSQSAFNSSLSSDLCSPPTTDGHAVS